MKTKWIPIVMVLMAGLTAASDFRFWVEPKLGRTSSGLGAGVGVHAAYKYLSLGYQHVGAEEFCIMCDDSESMVADDFLAGPRFELPFGSLSLLTGIGWVEGVRKENFVSNGGMFTDGEYDLVEYSGYNMPVMVTLTLNGFLAGVGLNLVTHNHSANQETGVFLSLPLGYLADPKPAH